MAFSRALARHPLAIFGALLTTASAAVFIALVIAVLAGWLVTTRTQGSSSSSPSRRLHHRPAADPARHVAGAAPASQATRTPSQTGRCSTSETPASGERRSRSRRSPPSTSSSSCSRATARCTGWSRRRSADRCATRRCSRSSPRGRPGHTRVSPALTATSARVRRDSSTPSCLACGSSCT